MAASTPHPRRRRFSSVSSKFTYTTHRATGLCLAFSFGTDLDDITYDGSYFVLGGVADGGPGEAIGDLSITNSHLTLHVGDTDGSEVVDGFSSITMTDNTIIAGFEGAFDGLRSAFHFEGVNPAGGTGTVTITGNSFDGLGGGTSNIPVLNLGNVTGTVDDNDFTDVGIGVMVSSENGGLSITNNDFENITVQDAENGDGFDLATGIWLGNEGDAADAVNIDGNRFSRNVSDIRTSIAGSPSDENTVITDNGFGANPVQNNLPIVFTINEGNTIGVVTYNQDVAFAPNGGTFDGGAGDEVVFGPTGDETLNGNDGSDLLFGGAGTDILDGGAGNDILDGGASDSGNELFNELTGGEGADVFHGNVGFAGTLDGTDEFIAWANGFSIVQDFESGDSLDLGLEVTTVATKTNDGIGIASIEDVFDILGTYGTDFDEAGEAAVLEITGGDYVGTYVAAVTGTEVPADFPVSGPATGVSIEVIGLANTGLDLGLTVA